MEHTMTHIPGESGNILFTENPSISPVKAVVNCSVFDFKEMPFPEHKDSGSLTCKSPETHLSKARSVLSIDSERKKVSLVVDIRDPHSLVFNGDVKENPVIKSMGINDPDTTWTMDALLKLVRQHPTIFGGVAGFKGVVDDITNISMRVESDFVNSNDYRGNTAVSKIKKLTGSIPTGFAINISPIPGHTQKQSYTIGLSLFVDGDVVRCQLFSFELLCDLENAFDAEVLAIQNTYTSRCKIVRI